MSITIPWSVSVGGWLLTRDAYHGSIDEIMKQVGFNHPEKYQQIHGGPGLTGLNQAVSGWAGKIAQQFDEVANLLDEANKKAGIAWTGQAAEQHGSSLGPMTQFIRDAKEVSTAVGGAAGKNAASFQDVKYGMPEPVKVDASDSLLDKAGAWLTGSETDLQQQEQQASEAAQRAKEIYQNYDQAITTSSSSLPSYPEPPQMSYNQGSQGSTGGTPVGLGMGAGGGSYQPVGGSGGHVAGGSGAGGSFGSGSGSGDFSGSPAQSESAWAAPASTGPGLGAGAPGVGPGAGGSTGWGGVLAGGLGAATGSGAGGASSGRGGLGAGGRAGGLGGAANEAASRSGAAAGRGGSAGAMGAGRGQGKEGEDDLEHENKYMIDTDEAWADLGLPKVAPPVFGDWDNE